MHCEDGLALPALYPPCLIYLSPLPFASLSLSLSHSTTRLSHSDGLHPTLQLMELQEDVTKVLHQAPHTERLMHQVQTNLEKSTEQLQSVVGKTAVMEGALGKIALTVDEFKVLRADLVARVHSLENPKVDRMGGVEEMTKNLEKQVKLLTQNWMNNWGSHEQSMTLLRQDIMLHVDQLRNKCDNMVSGGHAATADGSGSLTFVRMDEEERSMLQKAIEQHGRDIARIDNKKADAQLVLGVLADKADSSQLDAKMDKAAFEARIANLEAALSRGLVASTAASGSVADAASVDDTFASQLINDLAIAQAQVQAVGAAAQQQQQQNSHQRPSTGDPLLRPSTAPPESFAAMPSPEPIRQLAPAHRIDPAAAALQSETQEHQRLLQQMGKRQGSMQKQAARGGHQRPQSTPPVLPGTVIPGAMSMEEGMEQPSRQHRGAPGGGAPSDIPGAAISAQKRLMIARKDKTHPSLRKGPGLSITPSTAWAPNPGKIRPGTANTGASKSGGHAVYKFDSRGDGDARSMAPLPSLDVPGDDARVEGWPRNSATSTPQIRPGTAVSRGEGDA